MTEHHALIERLRKRASRAGMLLVDPPRPSADMLLFNEAADALIALTPAETAKEMRDAPHALIDILRDRSISSGPCQEGFRTVVYFDNPEDAHRLGGLLVDLSLITPAPPTAAGDESVLGLIAMLEAISSEEGSTVFEHTTEEIGIEVMENHKAILAGLRRTPPTAAPETKGEVTQEDRQAASDVLWQSDRHRASCRAKDGELDDDLVVQAFMKHRTTAISTLQAEVERQTEKALTFKRYWDNEREACRKARDERDGLVHRLDEMTTERDASEQFNGECEARATAAEAEVRKLREQAQFLIDRIDEMDWSLDSEEFANEWSGHVDPPLSRLRQALSPKEPSDDRS